MKIVVGNWRAEVERWRRPLQCPALQSALWAITDDMTPQQRVEEVQEWADVSRVRHLCFACVAIGACLTEIACKSRPEYHRGRVFGQLGLFFDKLGLLPHTLFLTLIPCEESCNGIPIRVDTIGSDVFASTSVVSWHICWMATASNVTHMLCPRCIQSDLPSLSEISRCLSEDVITGTHEWVIYNCLLVWGVVYSLLVPSLVLIRSPTPNQPFFLRRRHPCDGLRDVQEHDAGHPAVPKAGSLPPLWSCHSRLGLLCC